MSDQEKPIKIRHQNNGACPKCQQIFEKYPGFDPELKSWFEKVQAKHSTAHISCAGRGMDDQEECVKEGKSRAHWKFSAHNWNCAIDIFHMKVNDDGTVQTLYDRPWYIEVVQPNLIPSLEWYGSPHASFPELPHVEKAGWRKLAQQGKLKLVE